MKTNAKSKRTTDKKVELSDEHFNRIKDVDIRLDVMTAVKKLYNSEKYEPAKIGKKEHNVKRKVIEMTYEDVNQFEIPKKIQRTVSRKHFENIATEWNTYKQAPILAFRVGSKTVIPDGQHRIKGFITAWTLVDMYNRENETTHDLPTIWVELMEFDSEVLNSVDFLGEDDNDIVDSTGTEDFITSVFLGRNATKSLSAADKFAAMVALGSQRAIDIAKICEDLNLTYTTDGRNNDGGIISISSLNTAYNYSSHDIVKKNKKLNGGQDTTTYETRMKTIKEVLELIIEVWGQGVASDTVVDRMLFGSLVLFVYKHSTNENKVDLKKLKNMLLNKYTDNDIMISTTKFRDMLFSEAIKWATKTSNTIPPGMDTNTIRMYGIIWTELYNNYAHPETKLDSDTKIFYTGSKNNK